jgi:hypothetical protein
MNSDILTEPAPNREAPNLEPSVAETLQTVGEMASKPPAPSPAEITLLAKQLYQDTNREKGHDMDNWLSAEHALAQKIKVQQELEKACQRGHF